MNFSYCLCARIVRMISKKSLVLGFRGFEKYDPAISILNDMLVIQAGKKQVIVYLHNADSNNYSAS